MIIVHDDEGRITGIHGVYPPDYQDLLIATGASFIEVDLNADAHEVSQQAYVADGELFQRPSIPPLTRKTLAANEIDTILITGLPDPCTVNVDGDDHEITGGRLEFQTGTPGTYHLKIDCWPFLPWQAEIAAS